MAGRRFSIILSFSPMAIAAASTAAAAAAAAARCRQAHCHLLLGSFHRRPLP